MGFDEATLLFAEPSFIRGVGRAVDLGATRNNYNDSDTPEEADARALRSDWAAVGKDLRSAMRTLDRELCHV